MRMIETTAKTPEEAIEIALKELDVERPDVEIDVVSKGKAGILGIGGEPAKVRVTVLDKPPDAVVATTDILQSLISLMDVSATITLVHAEREDVGGPVFDVDGDDSGLLIGRRGETLRALQFLVSFIASRRLGYRVNLFVDVSGYQERRYETLRSLAQRNARRVASSGREITLEPMPPNERRIVHMALADDPDVNTVSDGVDDGRRVVIEPID
ncbi:MAG: RNA-binding cell elongation regulator Jag/EloR [SAR202 cluster bacterium]|jgi:spoIIIJ-associated protein|nr:RNA-binding cell elongation regulator Jag/EloR [SAR202 cluster bacterium]